MARNNGRSVFIECPNRGLECRFDALEVDREGWIFAFRY